MAPQQRRARVMKNYSSTLLHTFLLPPLNNTHNEHPPKSSKEIPFHLIQFLHNGELIGELQRQGRIAYPPSQPPGAAKRRQRMSRRRSGDS